MTDTGLTAVNLFAGIEGFGLAMRQAGIRTVAAVEIDKEARGVAHDQFPDTTYFNDVCEVTADDLRAAGFVPERGVVTAGWPCQDLSVAGRRLGLGGARSGLFWEVIRLLRDLRPRWFVLENVPGLLSTVCPCLGDGACGGWTSRDGDGIETRHACVAPHPVRGGACGFDGTRGRCMELHGGAMGAVLGALADLGYGVAYRVLDAQHFGVPQRRRRVVFVGCLGDWAAPAQVLLEPEGGGGDSAAGGAARPGAAVVSALRASIGGADDNDGQGGRLIAGPLQREPGRRADIDGAAAGSLVTGPLQAQGAGGRGHRVDAEGAANGHLVLSPTLTAGMGSNVGHPGDAGKDDIILSVATALTTRAGSTFDDQQTGQLVPVAIDRAQITSRENRVNPQPGDPAMPLAATGSPHVAYALRADPGGTGQGHNTNYVTVTGPTTHALTSEGADASEDGTGRDTPIVPMAFDWQSDGSDRVRGNISTARTSTLGTTNRDAVMAPLPVAWRGRGVEVGDQPVANTIRSGGSGHTGDQMGYVLTQAVRRLTPVECVPPWTVLLGDDKPISEYAVGDPVLSMVEETGVVKDVMVRHHDGDMLTIKAQGLLPIDVTEEHPLLVLSGSKTKGRHGGRVTLADEPEWIPAGQVKRWQDGSGHFLLIPRLRGTHADEVVDLSQYVAVNNRNLAQTRETRGLPTVFRLDAGGAWLLGAYVAEGCAGVKADLSSGWVEITPGWDRPFAERIAAELRNQGFRPHVRDGKTSIHVRVASAPLARMLRALCGEGAARKRIPDAVLLHHDLAVVRAFLDGYLAGDGYQRTGLNVAGANTASRTLAMHLQLAQARLGVFSTVRRVTRSGGVIDGRAIRGGALWMVTWRKSLLPMRHARHKVTDRFIAVPVQGVERRHYSGDVWNVETSDNTYLVANAVVHNCERLQGYPDGWTATSWGKPQSDSARYRQLGNSIAVPVFAWTARRLVAVDAALRGVAA